MKRCFADGSDGAAEGGFELTSFPYFAALKYPNFARHWFLLPTGHVNWIRSMPDATDGSFPIGLSLRCESRA